MQFPVFFSMQAGIPIYIEETDMPGIPAKNFVNPQSMSSTPTRTNTEQKRQQGRLRVAIDAHYRFVGEEEWLVCTLFDISPNGMALGGKKSFYSGDKVEVRFTLEKKTVLAHLEITNLIGKKAGGRVTQMSDADRALVQEVLNRELLSGNTRLT